jgi:hypothetical protein
MKLTTNYQNLMLRKTDVLDISRIGIFAKWKRSLLNTGTGKEYDEIGHQMANGKWKMLKKSS